MCADNPTGPFSGLRSLTIDWLVIVSVLVCIVSVVFAGTIIVEVVKGRLH